ncbi:catalase [Ferrovibrio terrae]|uniref:catalase n=1 Tax=Ferrovibrio terrae TaxID=2594003 RepID=UPI0031378B03
MAKTPRDAKKTAPNNKTKTVTGKGGETHQQADGADHRLTTNQGTVIADNQNSLKSGARGPTLLEDFILREKITHFDHERIPERIVHARGSGAHGYFQPYKDLSRLTRAAFLRNPKEKTKVFVRFSTVAGGAGSADTVRDVRGFAVKFYTSEGNFDLVGNNIPVFFIQDAMKFPDLVHSVKMEPDRAFPQAASAHDTFWDFVSLMPESTHMLMWAMSDRGIPRSYRMMEGFGVHTFRFVNEKGKSTFVKFHWRPTIGAVSLIWDEAVKLAGADYDFHRRDLWNAIAAGDFPEFELGIQAFEEKTADRLGFDVLDPTKVIPEEVVPLEMIGRLVLDRNPDNFFAETEQVAFHPGHVVPGIDFTNDPLLQGRLFSYTDTQLSRLGGPNFHEIPINRPVCPMRNFQRDGIHRMAVPQGRVNYEPNSLDPDSPREHPTAGFNTFPEPAEGGKLRQRPESFADHYSHARLFWLSMTKPEQTHIVSAFAFELAKVGTISIRTRMLGRLKLVHKDLCAGVEAALGMEGQADTLTPAVPAKTMQPSPALSLIAKAPPTIKGRKIGVLVTDGTDAKLLAAVQKAVDGEGALVEIVAPKIGGAKLSDGKTLVAHHTISGGPSVLFDAVVVLPSADGVKALVREAGAVAWVHDAFSHLKVIGHVAAAKPLLVKAGVEADDGVVSLDTSSGAKAFIAAAKQHRIWDREPKLRSPG